MITRRTFTTAAATMLAAGHLSTRAMAATANWDMSTVCPDANFHTQNAMAFAEEVWKQTGGAVGLSRRNEALVAWPWRPFLPLLRRASTRRRRRRCASCSTGSIASAGSTAAAC